MNVAASRVVRSIAGHPCEQGGAVPHTMVPISGLIASIVTGRGARGPGSQATIGGWQPSGDYPGIRRSNIRDPSIHDPGSSRSITPGSSDPSSREPSLHDPGSRRSTTPGSSDPPSRDPLIHDPGIRRSTPHVTFGAILPRTHPNSAELPLPLCPMVANSKPVEQRNYSTEAM